MKKLKRLCLTHSKNRKSKCVLVLRKKCDACILGRQRSLQFYKENKDRVLKYRKINKKKLKKRAKEYTRKNSEKLNKYAKKYYKTNKDIIYKKERANDLAKIEIDKINGSKKSKSQKGIFIKRINNKLNKTINTLNTKLKPN